MTFTAIGAFGGIYFIISHGKNLNQGGWKDGQSQIAGYDLRD